MSTDPNPSPQLDNPRPPQPHASPAAPTTVTLNPQPRVQPHPADATFAPAPVEYPRSRLLAQLKRRSRLPEDDARRDSGMASSLVSAAPGPSSEVGELDPQDHQEQQQEEGEGVPEIVVEEAPSSPSSPSRSAAVAAAAAAFGGGAAGTVGRPLPASGPASASAAKSQPNKLRKKRSGRPTSSSGRGEEVQEAKMDEARPTVRMVQRQQQDEEEENDKFKRISTDIPTGELDDVFSSEQLTFSKRGSMLWAGRHARGGSGGGGEGAGLVVEGGRELSREERRMSKRVRSMYEPGIVVEDEDDEGEGGEEDDKVMELPGGVAASPRVGSPVPDGQGRMRSASALTAGRREPFEAAGGIEDFTDVDVRDVDRYGFIRTRSQRSSVVSSPIPPGSPDTSRATRPATALATVDEVAPPSNRLSVANGGGPSLRTSPSVVSARSRRSTASRLSLSRKQRWADEAGTMLTPAFPASATPTPDPAAAPSRTALEAKRAAKWEAMAKPVPSSASAAGAGTAFTFDTASPKLISRVYKGIPDRWRAPAWRAFLTASAARRSPTGVPTPSDAALVAAYRAFQRADCPDDPQIDMDVPRTVAAHVMFRRRYRGGQRLLFRLLRALALQFPAVGYAQGMAPIAATLLAYFDEEEAFVVAVRLWALRGVAALYGGEGDGFGGLMAALGVLQRRWVGRSAPAVAAALEGLDIGMSAFGAKWYLTLFNYALPFEAQLRVWDVLMLAGDPPRGAPGYWVGGDEVSAANEVSTGSRVGAANEKSAAGKASSAGTPTKLAKGAKSKEELKEPPAPHVDVLHATATALLTGLADVLVGAEFENAMHALTGPVPVGRADVLMRGVRREMRERGGR